MNKYLMAAGLLGFLAAGAWAQTGGSNRLGSCAADAQTLCPIKDKVSGEYMSCLMKNIGKIQNDDCRAKVQKFQERDAAIKQACAADIKTDKCKKDIGTGLLQCLGEHKSSLSVGCVGELKRGKSS